MIPRTATAPGPSTPSINARLTATHRRTNSSSFSLHSIPNSFRTRTYVRINLARRQNQPDNLDPTGNQLREAE